MAGGGKVEAAGRETSDRSDGPPVLWHLKVSHYNEKARWALDYKGVPHVRKALIPGRHEAVARKLVGGTTFPVLELDGEAIGDSTEIIAALERKHPDPPLYPSDADERRRALELEDFFDEEFGPYTRLLAVYHGFKDPGVALGMFAPDLPRRRRVVARAMFGAIKRRTTDALGADDAGAERAFEKVRAGGERFRAELQPSGYLVGDRFTVADLTLAALTAPVMAPEQYPYPQPQRGHELFAAPREALAESGLLDWARDIYARHRGTSAEIPAAG
jgi:glutathione S-transferase